MVDVAVQLPSVGEVLVRPPGSRFDPTPGPRPVRAGTDLGVDDEVLVEALGPSQVGHSDGTVRDGCDCRSMTSVSIQPGAVVQNRQGTLPSSAVATGCA